MESTRRQQLVVQWRRLVTGVTGLPWARYLNMPTIAALAGLSVG